MSREINYMSEVMQAYRDGKEIEYFNIHTCKWKASKEPKWNWIDLDYRIKPEQKKTKDKQ